MSDHPVIKSLAFIGLVLGIFASAVTIYSWAVDQNFISSAIPDSQLSVFEQSATHVWQSLRTNWTLGPFLSALLLLIAMTVIGAIIAEAFYISWDDELLPFLGFKILFSPLPLVWIGLYFDQVGLVWASVFALSYLVVPWVIFLIFVGLLELIEERNTTKELVGTVRTVKTAEVTSMFRGPAKKLEIHVDRSDDDCDAKILYTTIDSSQKLPRVKPGYLITAKGGWSDGIFCARELEISKP